MFVLILLHGVGRIEISSEAGVQKKGLQESVCIYR